MLPSRLALPAALVLLALSGPAPTTLAQTRPPPARPAPAPAAAPAPAPAVAPVAAAVPATPQQTTASFADWTLRCSRLGPAPGTQFCEVAQGVQREDRPVAQMAIGRPNKGQSLHLTILVPPNASFSTQPVLLPPREGDGPPVELSWRRCVPGGCTADGTLAEEAVQRMRGWTEPARVSFPDATGRPAVLPFSPRGLPQALDALAKEEAG